MTVRPAGIEVLAYLPPPLLGHLRVVLAGSSAHVLRVADRWETFADAIRSTTADVVVADPCADGVRRGVSLAALLESRPTLPLVVYTPVAPPSFQAIAELARLCAHYAVHQVVLYRYDDEPRRFLELLEQQPGSSMSAALLERIAPAIDALPATLARAVDRLIRRPTEFEDVADLARVARVTVRTAYRHLAGAGFVSPRALIVAARLLHATPTRAIRGNPSSRSPPASATARRVCSRSTCGRYSGRHPARCGGRCGRRTSWPPSRSG